MPHQLTRADYERMERRQVEVLREMDRLKAQGVGENDPRMRSLYAAYENLEYMCNS